MRFMESFNLQEWTRIGAMNRLLKGARLCAEHQPQQVRMWKRFELFPHAMGVRERCGWSLGHSRAPKPRFMGSFDLQPGTIGATNRLGKVGRVTPCAPFFAP